MSFSFAFEVDDGDDELAFETAKLSIDQPAADADAPALPHAQQDLDELLDTLPPLISYTPVTVHLSRPGPPTATLLRRDLFDARFQVIAQHESDDDDDDESVPASAPSRADKGKAREAFVDEESDLVKGVYEGGLKTWECSLDLVDCLYGLNLAGPPQDDDQDRVRGKSFLEIGCGTALPTCAVFARLVAEIRRAPSSPEHPPPAVTRIHLQDYNKQVLSLITLPNLLLAYAKDLAFADPTSTVPAGDIELTPEFLASFESMLATERIELRFFSGDWRGMTIPPDERYDVLLTSETIYSLPSLAPLLDLVQAACKPETTCLVACKRIYFGVGGGENEFRRRVAERQGQVETVWGEGEGEGRTKGVGRVVMSVKWE